MVILGFYQTNCIWDSPLISTAGLILQFVYVFNQKKIIRYNRTNENKYDRKCA